MESYMDPRREILSITKAAEELRQKTVADPNYFEDLKRVLARMDRLDKTVGPGLKVGKSLRFGVADGRAYYIVIGIRRQVVEVIHVSLSDGYRFAGVSLDAKGREVTLRGVAEQNIKMREAMGSIFSR